MSLCISAAFLLSAGSAIADTSNKVTICHDHTITIAEAGLNGHIPHHIGDYMGACREPSTPVCSSSFSDVGKTYVVPASADGLKHCINASGESGVYVDLVTGQPHQLQYKSSAARNMRSVYGR